MHKDAKIYIAGHRGMVGAAIVRRLRAEGFENLLLKTHAELNLCDGQATTDFFQQEKPDVAIIAAAKVGGIHANDTYPADFLRDNLGIALNSIDGAWRAGTGRLLFLGSSCIYPREAPQPMTEDCLLTSPLEKTNEAYALAKIAGLKLAQTYRRQYGVLFHSAMPTNLYGPGDNYHPENSHVIPALIRRFHEAKETDAPNVTLWGTGSPRREFLHVDDLAAGLLHLLQLSNPPDWVNVGTGEDITIRELAGLVATAIGYQGERIQDTSKPDGTPRKLMDISRIRATGWNPTIGIEEGLKQTYASFIQEKAAGILRE